MQIQGTVSKPALLAEAPATVQPSAAAQEKAAAPVTPKPPSDTVTISSAGKAALAEAMETAAQTAQEARGGDHQAQRLQARLAASHSHA